MRMRRHAAHQGFIDGPMLISLPRATIFRHDAAFTCKPPKADASRRRLEAPESVIVYFQDFGRAMPFHATARPTRLPRHLRRMMAPISQLISPVTRLSYRFQEACRLLRHHDMLVGFSVSLRHIKWSMLSIVTRGEMLAFRHAIRES